MTLPIALAATLLNGCVTRAVWQHKAFHVPAPEPALKLSIAPRARDILVEYAEVNERNGQSQRRAYLLLGNAERIEQGKKPLFVDPRLYRDLELVPIYCETSLAGLLSPPFDLYATTNRYSFTLHSRGQEPTTHSLPVFFDGVTRTRQVLLTPPAVLADASIVGGIIGGIVLYSVAQSESSFEP